MLFRGSSSKKKGQFVALEAMTSVVATTMKMRDDVVTEGHEADALMKNAPQAEDHLFVVPKVVEQE